MSIITEEEKARNRALWAEKERVWNATESPRPWSVNAAFLEDNSFGTSPPPILDANGDAVIIASEWITMRRADIEMIVRLANSGLEAA